MSEFISKNFVDVLQAVLGDGAAGLHEPSIDVDDFESLRKCLDSTFVSSVGPFVDHFEAEVRRFCGANHAIAVVNGTAALHAVLHALGVSKNHEVLVPALSFVATANAVAYCNATPNFVDISSDTLGVCVDKLDAYLERTCELREGVCLNLNTEKVVHSVIPMHTYGHPVAMHRLLDVAARWNIQVVEDGAESLGTTFNGQHMGTFGKAGIISFNGNKIITTGGGGAIITNDDILARRLKHITTTARLNGADDFYHDQIGFNYRMPNINAALGCSQLAKIKSLLTKKRTLYEAYKEEFQKIDQIELFEEPIGARSNYWLQTVILDTSVERQRRDIIEAAQARGFGVRPAWRLLSELPMFKHCPKDDLSVSKSIGNRIINIPSGASLVSRMGRRGGQ